MSYSPGVGLKLNKTFVDHSHKCYDNVSPSTSGRLDRFLVKSFVAGFVSTFLFKQPGELLLKTKRQLCMDEGSIQTLSSTSPHSIKCVDAVNGNGAICHFSEINLLPKKLLGMFQKHHGMLWAKTSTSVIQLHHLNLCLVTSPGEAQYPL